MSLSIGQCATLACLWEVSIPKPGNVHRGADFEDVPFEDFITSAVAIGPAMQSAADGARVGSAILDAVRATRRQVATNTNLGTILLLAPLAAVPRDEPLADGVPDVLHALDATDACDVYEAIGQARPGGMGQVDANDLGGTPPEQLVEAMRSAAPRDLVARQYAEDFAPLFRSAIAPLRADLDTGRPLRDAVIRTHLQLMQAYPDSLIGRKCGVAIAEESAARAGAVLAAGSHESGRYLAALADFDFWLRSDGHRRNPGTTADMIAAALFALLRDGIIGGDPWSHPARRVCP